MSLIRWMLLRVTSLFAAQSNLVGEVVDSVAAEASAKEAVASPIKCSRDYDYIRVAAPLCRYDEPPADKPLHNTVLFASREPFRMATLRNFKGIAG